MHMHYANSRDAMFKLNGIGAMTFVALFIDEESNNVLQHQSICSVLHVLDIEYINPLESRIHPNINQAILSCQSQSSLRLFAHLLIAFQSFVSKQYAYH